MLIEGVGRNCGLFPVIRLLPSAKESIKLGRNMNDDWNISFINLNVNRQSKCILKKHFPGTEEKAWLCHLYLDMLVYLVTNFFSQKNNVCCSCLKGEKPSFTFK